MLCSLSVDASAIQAQVAEVNALLESASSEVFERFSGLLRSYLREPGPDILLGEFVPATDADGAHCVVCTPRFGSEFEALVAALRAGKFHV